MAIAFDAASNSGVQGVASYSFSHTCTGSNLWLMVGITTSNTTVSGVTYNSVSMTQINTVSFAFGQGNTYIFGLKNPSTGSNSVAVTLAGANTSVAGAMSFTGVDQTTTTEGSATASGSGSPGTVNVTTVADNDWVVDAVGSNDTTITVGADQTQRVNVSASLGMSHEGPKTPAGSVTMSWSIDDFWGICAVAIIPASGGGGRTSKNTRSNPLGVEAGMGWRMGL